MNLDNIESELLEIAQERSLDQIQQLGIPNTDMPFLQISQAGLDSLRSDDSMVDGIIEVINKINS